MDWQGSTPLLLIVSGMLALPNQGVPYQTGSAKTKLIFPHRVQAGIKIRPTKRFRFMFDVHWANWSSTYSNDIQIDQDLQLLQMVKLMGYTYGHRNFVVIRNLKDEIHWSAALEYQVSRKMALRCGYEYRPSSIPNDRFDLQYFIPDLHFFGLGAEVKLPHKITLDFALGWLTNPSHKVPNNSSLNLNSTDFFYPVYNPYAGLDYEQETNLYMVSGALTMPFASFIEHQKLIMAKQHEVIVKIVDLLKMPIELLKK